MFRLLCWYFSNYKRSDRLGGDNSPNLILLIYLTFLLLYLLASNNVQAMMNESDFSGNESSISDIERPPIPPPQETIVDLPHNGDMFNVDDDDFSDDEDDTVTELDMAGNLPRRMAVGAGGIAGGSAVLVGSYLIAKTLKDNWALVTEEEKKSALDAVNKKLDNLFGEARDKNLGSEEDTKRLRDDGPSMQDPKEFLLP